jgi:23S rRNA (guanosine2251-2'-O)-methyltransferase
MESPDASLEVVGGVRPVEELIASGRREVYKILVAKGRRGLGPLLRQAERRRIVVEFSNRGQLDQLCASPHQGVVALASPYRYWDVEELKERFAKSKGLSCLLALDAIEDPMNLGAVLRVAGAFGVDGVLITRDRACGLTPTVAKASAGAVEHVSVARVVNLTRALEELKEAGFWVIGTDPEASESVEGFGWDRDVVIVLGSEGRGMRPRVASTCDATVAVPLPGPVAALNVAATAAILCYEICRQRRQRIEKPT